MGQNKILILDGRFLKLEKADSISSLLFREIFSKEEREEFDL